jgi:membrane-bound serine protease (ClpP class)
MTKAVQARRRIPTTGQEELVGQVGVVRKALDPNGLVFVHGELWQARTSGEAVAVGEQVRVEGIEDGLVLEVRRAEEPAVAPA